MNHDYTVLGGMSRVNVGKLLSIAAAALSALAVYIVLLIIDIAATFGWNATLTPSIMSLLSAGAVFAILYGLLNKYVWRWRLASRFLCVPDLSGNWRCAGKTLYAEDGSVKNEWVGTVTIVQSWDKIRVRLKTSQSGSNSKSAAIIYDEADGFRLFYSYSNDPRIGEVALKSHRGFADIIFSHDLKTAEGEYFNGHGRYTFGTMHLERQ